MAKPIPASPLAPPTASLPLHSHLPSCTASYTHSSASPSQANIHSSRPSATLLALLATVAASSTAVDGRPLDADSPPPDFLCPLFPSDPSPECPIHSQPDVVNDNVAEEELYWLSPTPTRKRRANKRVVFIPDKYVQGSDGRWRRESTWSLYGSTVCDVRTLHHFDHSPHSPRQHYLTTLLAVR